MSNILLYLHCSNYDYTSMVKGKYVVIGCRLNVFPQIVEYQPAPTDKSMPDSDVGNNSGK